MCYYNGPDSSICQSGFTCLALLEGLEHGICSFFWGIDVLQVDEKRSVEAAGYTAA